MPRFSIIMPTYQREHIIGYTIEHIHKQTFADWELILVDNFGTGYNYTEAVKPYPRIRHFIYNEKRGASHARNFGVQHIKGELTCFFDDDDVMHPKYLEEFNNVFQNPKIMMAHCGMQTGGVTNFSFATPEVVIRSQFVTPTWLPCNCDDQMYFDKIAVANKWWEGNQITTVNTILVTAGSNPRGGLRCKDAAF